MTNLTIINTNARSLCPKLRSLIDCIGEMEASLAIVTETWMKKGQAMTELEDELLLGNGLGIMARNREALSNGVAYGGVALVWKEALGSFREVELPNPQGYEVLVAAGTVRGYSRKMIVVACYLPPNMTRVKGAAALDFIEETVIAMKRRFKDPYLVIAGDFNQWDVGGTLENLSLIHI